MVLFGANCPFKRSERTGERARSRETKTAVIPLRISAGSATSFTGNLHIYSFDLQIFIFIFIQSKRLEKDIIYGI